MTKLEVAKEISEAVLEHCYGYHRVNDNMVERTSLVVKNVLDKHTEQLEQAARQILEALEEMNLSSDYWNKKITTLREALVGRQAIMKECRHCGFLCKPNDNNSKKWYPLEQAEQRSDSKHTEPVAWINEDELPEHYPYDDMYQSSKVINGVRMFPNVKVSDRSMFYALTKDHTWISVTETQFNKLKTECRMKCYTAPVRIKDLTPDEIAEVFRVNRIAGRLSSVEIARAVIAADREKNNV